jgi:hypothetical protein
MGHPAAQSLPGQPPSRELRRAAWHSVAVEAPLPGKRVVLARPASAVDAFMRCRPSDNEGVQNGHACLPPETLETAGGDAGVVDGVLGVAVAEIILD